MPRSLCHRIAKEQCRRSIDYYSRVSSADPFCGLQPCQQVDEAISFILSLAGLETAVSCVSRVGQILLGSGVIVKQPGEVFFFFVSPRLKTALKAIYYNQMRDFSGDDRDRTGNLRLAKPALSQLSYVPKRKSEARMVSGFGSLRNWAYVDSNHGPQLYQSCALAN